MEKKNNSKYPDTHTVSHFHPLTLPQEKKKHHLCLLFCLCHWAYLKLTFVTTSSEPFRPNSLNLLQCIPFCFWVDRPLNLIGGKKKKKECDMFVYVPAGRMMLLYQPLDFPPKSLIWPLTNSKNSHMHLFYFGRRLPYIIGQKALVTTVTPYFSHDVCHKNTLTCHF